MDENEKMSPSEKSPNPDEFNRTIVIQPPERKKRTSRNETTPFHKIMKPFRRRKEEPGDIIGHVDLSHYTDAEPDTSAQLTRPLSQLDSRYSILEERARGGTATVSIARDKNLRRIVAIKSMKKDSEKKTELIDAFVSEAKVTAQLDHPSIIPIYGLTGDDENGVHLIMKLVNGKTLRDYLRNLVLNYRIRGIKVFDEDAMLRRRLELFLRVCDAIAYAHHRNIMHRDLKPENIMIGEYMEVFVMDWGLARIIPKEGEEPSEDEKMSGTPRYFSPEALRGERCDARADIFTLGLILQEITTLQFAVKGKDEKDCMEHIVGGELEPVTHLFGYKIDKPLKAIIRKATAYRPEERYQSVNELSEDIRRYMGGLSTSALPEDIFTRTMRSLHRHRRGFLTFVTALLFGSAAITAYAIFRQLETTREMTLQRQSLNYIYNRTAVVARHLDITALHIQEQLSALSRIAAYLITYNTESDEGKPPVFRPPMDQIGKTEPGMFYSPYYKRMVSLDYGIRTMAPNSDPEQCKRFTAKVSPVITKMKNIVLGSKTGYRFDLEDYEKLKTDYLYNGFPIRSVFIGSKCGVKLLYPWRGNYSRNIDPRQRDWYRNALGKTGSVWGKPYMDLDSVSGLSIPCSIQIFDLNGRFCGVAGLDVSVNQLTNSILDKGNVGDYVLEKAVINNDGHVIFSTKSEYYNKTFDPEKFHQDAEFKTPLYRTDEIRNRILKRGRDYGTIVVNEGEESTVYCYAYLEIFDMFYVVAADYRKLVEHVKNVRAEESRRNL